MTDVASTAAQIAGRRWVRLGYLVILGAAFAAVVVSVRAWGDRSSLALAACVAVMWVGSFLLAHGRKLNGELAPGAFNVGRGLLSLPLGLLIAYYGPTIEQIGAWWMLLLPHETYDLAAATGLPHWPALGLTLVFAPLEILLAVLVSQLAIVSPLAAVLGRSHPLVETVRELVGGIEVETAATGAGRSESTAWAGETVFRNAPQA